jgi:hypothetical protein
MRPALRQNPISLVPTRRNVPAAATTELRRFARIPSRCRAWVRDRYGVWDGWTEDLSPRGCRIAMRRKHSVGTLVRLTLVAEHIVEPLIVSGQIVWVSEGATARAGVSFTGSPSDVPGAGAWVRTLEAAAAGRTGEAAPGVTIVSGGPQRLDVVVSPPEPHDASPAALARRLAERGEELVRAGQRGAGEVLLRRALALTPDDARIIALLEGDPPGGGAVPKGAA